MLKYIILFVLLAALLTAVILITLYQKNNELIVLDTETTGLTSEDEILQLSIINKKGQVLFNEYIKPIKNTKWPKAESIHGIAPEHVKDLPNFNYHLSKIQKIINNAKIIVGYNIPFDLRMLRQEGIVIPKEKEIFDVMTVFSTMYGEWSEYHQDYKWQKLSTCASYYNYKWDEKAHNSLGDVKATLFCYNKMLSAGGK